MTKKLENLNDLKDTILECILQYCDSVFYEQETISSKTDIISNHELIGEVKFSVSVETIIPSFTGSRDTPPEAGEFEYVLDSCAVIILYDKDEKNYKLRQKAVNKLLQKHLFEPLKD